MSSGRKEGTVYGESVWNYKSKAGKYECHLFSETQ